MNELISLQITMFLMMLAGVILKKTGIVGEEGKKNITDMVLYLVLPCNIVKSFMIDFSPDIIYSFAQILVLSILIQVGCTVLGKVLFVKMDSAKRKCLHYATICSNAGFLGNPVAEGVFGSMGLAMASVYLIPQRIVMWSAGLSVFTESPDRKSLIKKVITHPCIIACFLSLFLTLTQISLPGFLESALTSVSNCNTALSMIVIGMILAELNIREMADKSVLYYTVIRLIFIPLLVYIPCRLVGAESLVTGVSVLLAAMPAGATTSILASKYNGDAHFATKLVVISTLFSLITTPVWSMILI